MANLCLGCQKSITVPFYFCRACEVKFHLDGKDILDWPGWARQLARDAQRQRRQEAQRRKYEVRLADSGAIDVLFEGEWNTDFGGAVPERESIEHLQSLPPYTIQDYITQGWLQYAPYKTEKLNRAYRKATGIPTMKPKEYSIWNPV